MSRPNNKKPNDQQRESQDFLAKQGDRVEGESELVKRMYTENVELSLPSSETRSNKRNQRGRNV